MNRVILFALLAGCAATSAQEPAGISVISIVDHSPSGSPLVVKGDVTAYDKPAEQLRYSAKVRTSVTNASSKPIVLTVISLTGENVPGMNDKSSHDYYFPEMFEPQSTEEQEWTFGPFVSRTEVKVDGGSKWVDVEPERGAVQKVTATVLFVQFADGSTWGDRDEAKSALAVRRDSVKRLVHLSSVYRREGEAAFIDDLSKPTDLPAISTLQYLCNHNDDKTKVVDRLIRMVATVEEHSRMMKSAKQEP